MFACSKIEIGSFGTISCMSVTKWVHLQGGDGIMERFFSKVKELLQPGGYFILEPQPWKSYKSAVRKLVSLVNLASFPSPWASTHWALFGLPEWLQSSAK